MDRNILLSFDIEEFDIPEEYGQKIDEKTKLEVSVKGTRNILLLLEKLGIKATFFVTAYFAEKNKSLIKEIAKKHEIASHGFYHSIFSIEDLKKSKNTLEKISGKNVKGFRMPRLRPIDNRELEKAGYTYNSSMNPTYLPGRYNNFFKKRTAHYNKGILNIPTSTTPIIRFPIFWLSFKNFPSKLIKIASKISLTKDSYLNIYFHPWEFVDIKKFDLPKYISKKSGNEMLMALEKYILWLKKQGKFITISDFISTRLTYQLKQQNPKERPQKKLYKL